MTDRPAVHDLALDQEQEQDPQHGVHPMNPSSVNSALPEETNGEVP